MVLEGESKDNEPLSAPFPWGDDLSCASEPALTPA